MGMGKLLHTSIHLEPAIRAVLQEQAEAQERSVAKMINIYLRRALEAEGLMEPRPGKAPPADG